MWKVKTGNEAHCRAEPGGECSLTCNIVASGQQVATEAEQAPPITEAQDPSRGPDPPDVEAAYDSSNQDGDSRIVVRTSGEDDPLHPRNWPTTSRSKNIAVLSLLIFAQAWTGAAEPTMNTQISGEFGIGRTAGNLTIAMYVFDIGSGALSDPRRNKRALHGPDRILFRGKAEHVRGAPVLPEFRLWPAINAAPLLPASLFWLGWSNQPGVSIWSSLGACSVFGEVTIAIYVSSYEYIIDSYGEHAASGLASITMVRHLIAGAMAMAARPTYEGIDVH
ncbi:hypothetical protein DL767_009879 [Monosporascus sp. MG133]|nr:hypothetical protein DL767_009879 [Monosporascus sp. MG133]